MPQINLGKVVPEKGVDYFTNEEIQAIVALIHDQISADLSDMNSRINANSTNIQSLATNKANISDLATVATSGNYSDLNDSPDIPEIKNTESDSQSAGYSANYLNAITISEIGSNQNGNYIKFGDGTMICTGSQTFSVAMNTAWGSMYAGNYNSTINFPATFIEKPQLTLNADGSNLSCSIIGVQYTTSAITSIGCARGTSASGSVTIHYMAIGKWK